MAEVEQAPENGDTLDAMRERLALELPQHAGFDGWSDCALINAATAIDIDPAVARLAFAGATDMIDAWFATIDTAMAKRMTPARLAPLKIRERIAQLVESRLDHLAGSREALRRALAILAMPQNLPRLARLEWRAADLMWRLAGDTATDYNHYSKRIILGTVYAATLTVFLDDESDGLADTRAFLARRIDGIMRFEKAKARLTSGRLPGFSLPRFLGQLRYPAV